MSGKKSLITEDADPEEDANAQPIWLTLSTKRHITDQKHLKPSKVTIPHSLNTSTTTTICLITADPQKTYKELVKSPGFPSALASRITRVVGIDKLRKKHSQFEALRKLYSEHDIFLADDRVIIHMPKILGSVFYKTTAKRPIPVSIQEEPAKVEGKRVAREQGEGRRGPAKPQHVAAQIEKALSSAVVFLNPSTHTAVKIGYSSWNAQRLSENVEAAAGDLIEKYVPKKWRGVRALHVKGPSTAALPIWLANELWVDEQDVLGAEEAKAIEEAKKASKVDKKRKKRGLEGVESEEPKPGKKQKTVDSNDDKLDEEIRSRKEKLKLQKQQAMIEAEDGIVGIPKASKKSKKTKEITV